MEKTKKNIEYKWVVVAACFLMVFVCLGFCSSNRSIFLAPITEALDFKRSLFSFNDTVRFIATSIINLFFGVLVAKFGIRKIITAGFISLITAMLFYAYANTIYVFCLGGFFLGLGIAWTTTTVIGAVATRWVTPEHVGKTMGLIMAANGIGAAVSAQILSPIIYEEGNAFGFRNAYKLIAIILAATALIFLALYREKPKKLPPSAAHRFSEKNKNKDRKIQNLKEILHKKYFHVAALCVLFTGFTLQGFSSVYAAHMKDVGFDPSFIAIAVSIYSITLTGSKFLAGLLHDQIGLSKTMIICNVSAILAILLLATMSTGAFGQVRAVAYCVLCAMGLPLETIMLPLITAELVGVKAYAKTLGLIVSVNTAGYALGGPVVNLAYDLWGTYSPALFLMSGIMLVVTISFQLALVAAKKDRLAFQSYRLDAKPGRPQR